jgi:hypothetical protein
LVVESLLHNRETQIPVAGPLRLLGPWLWESSGADSLPPRVLPEATEDDAALATGADRLLAHPAFASWRAPAEAIYEAAAEALRHPGWELEVWVKRLAGDLFGEPTMAQVLGERLLSMSEWLLLAGDEELARVARVSAGALQEGAPQDQPLLQALIRRDLELVLRNNR